MVESLYQALSGAGLFNLDNQDNLEGIAKLVSALGTELVHQNEKFCRMEGQMEAALNAIQAAEVTLLYNPTYAEIWRGYVWTKIT